MIENTLEKCLEYNSELQQCGDAPMGLRWDVILSTPFWLISSRPKIFILLQIEDFSLTVILHNYTAFATYLNYSRLPWLWGRRSNWLKPCHFVVKNDSYCVHWRKVTKARMFRHSAGTCIFSNEGCRRTIKAEHDDRLENALPVNMKQQKSVLVRQAPAINGRDLHTLHFHVAEIPP